jgi:hypothetical protein
LPLFYPKAKTTSPAVVLVIAIEFPLVIESANLIPFVPMSVAAIPSFMHAPNLALPISPNSSPQAYATSASNF